MRTPEVERKTETLLQAQPPRVEEPEAKEIPWPAGLLLQQEKQPTCALQERVCVVLTQKAFTQLFGYVYATSQEVSCLGLVERRQSRSDSTRRLASSCFIVTEFFLVRQCSGPAHTEMEDASLAELVQRLIQEGRGEDAQRIRCWAHSHPGMGLFWSQTDEATCRRMVSDYLISLVVTEGFGIRCRLDLASPIRLTLDYVPVLYEMAQDEALKETCRKEVEE
ncbi:MAG: hypothetical protein FJ278_15365, partial [Planctomycetes bacterium]|nr:hypothetical protein [Planctomycetota bacterium]